MPSEAILFKVKMGRRIADCVLHIRDGKMYLWLGYLQRMLEPEPASALLSVWFTVPANIHGGWAPYKMPEKAHQRIMQLLIAERI